MKIRKRVRECENGKTTAVLFIPPGDMLFRNNIAEKEILQTKKNYNNMKNFLMNNSDKEKKSFSQLKHNFR
jgi:hypothetical protein